MYFVLIAFAFVLSIRYIISSPLIFRGRPLTKHGMIGLPQSTKSFETPTERWVEQILDHFNPTDTRKWKQRYYMNDTFFKTGGPVFLQLGGEGAANPVWVVNGQVATNYAPKFKALIVLLEHRYYGESRPTDDLSLDNLRYLTSNQALEDIAYFIGYLTTKLKLKNSKWIVFGGSYSGSLAAWFRLKYPHLSNGAIASSAPLIAIVNFQNYFGVVSESLGNSCVQAIRQATDELTDFIKTSNGCKQIEKKFSLCDELDGKILNDIRNLMETLAFNIAGIVQYNNDNIFNGNVAKELTIDDICIKMTNSSLGSPIERYSLINNFILDYNIQSCVDFKYKNLIDWLSHSNWNDSASEDGARQWTYQTCTEFGYFQSSSLKTQPFGNYFPINFIIQQCVDIFGTKINNNFIYKAVQYTNTDYGQLNSNIYKVVFPNGSIDPWHVLGVTKNLNPEAIAIYMNGTAHCADMYPSSSADPKQLVIARQTIVKYLKQFLQ